MRNTGNKERSAIQASPVEKTPASPVEKKPASPGELFPASPGKLYEQWLEKLPADDPLRGELLEIAGDEREITERFYQEISFGTAGLRGICGAGTNRMNVLTVGRATQGIANYILRSGEDPGRGVVIAYDCRYHSKEFSELSAEILAGNGIRAFLFPSMRPTPELSYAIRKLGAVSGINMTASHNPKEYNGYKVYWEDGAQISGEISDGMQREIAALGFWDDFARLPADEATARGLITMLGEEMDRDYYDYVRSMRQRGDAELDLSIPVVYTPLNGAGSIPMGILAAEEGYGSFFIVPEQKEPDPDFTTVGYPNPEDPKAFALAEELGRAKGAEVLIATDPDADRMAVEIADGHGGYRFLNGNQTGALLIAYMAESQRERGLLPWACQREEDMLPGAIGEDEKGLLPGADGAALSGRKAVMIKSIVTGDFGRAICDDYGIAVFEALTGFKNICGVIPRAQALGYRYFFGYEESIGCAPGEAVRDKDGICAAMLVMEMAAFYRKKGMSLGDFLDSLYRKYGYFAEEQVSLVLKGKEGAEQIAQIMAAFREKAPKEFGPFRVAGTTDYLRGQGEILPSNVLIFHLTDGSWFAMRPSGTEPKLKFYFYTRAEDAGAAETKVEELRDAVDVCVKLLQIPSNLAGVE